MKKTKKTVPSAAEPKQNEPAAPPETPQAQAAILLPETVEPEPFIKVPKISKKTAAMAKAAGIDIAGITEMAEKMNAFHDSVEERLKIITETLPAETAQKVFEAIRDAQQKALAAQRQVMAQNPQVQGEGGGGELGQVLSLLQQSGVLGGGGGIDEDMKKLYMESMRANIDFTKAIQTALVTKITAKAVTEVI